MKRGEVYRFHYLWGHEAEAGEESGRKIRRVCLMMEINGWLYLFPISGQVPQPRAPGDQRLYEVVPETELRRIGLGPEKVSHLILDDYNKVRSNELYDFESLTARDLQHAVSRKSCPPLPDRDAAETTDLRPRAALS